ncbi:unnamed protein product [Miscanthus lutarioriparius]|uniref:Nodulin-like domain-containing protein n=1 Tax=Miscanthus lutarioriparius TaxID=422564 RepID=A0A811P2E8_9POAL|nr:unnamed protein product [Miscanthus lutarioriparius]
MEMRHEWLARDNIERRRGMSVEQFVAEVEEPNRPVLLEGCIDTWPALQKWSRDYLLEISTGGQAGGDRAVVHAVRVPADPVVVGGATYAFGIYSQELRSVMGYDQCAVATLAFFKDLGPNVGVPAGLLNEVAPPWLVLAVGATMNLAGHLMVYLSLASRVARPPVWLMCAYIYAGANS